MRVSARILSIIVFCILAFSLFHPQAYAQTADQPSPVAQSTNAGNFQTPNVDPDVPRNHHSYTQVVLIDVLSAVMCQLTGIDPTDPQQPCLGVNTTTGKVGLAPTASQTFGQAKSQEPQVGGALGTMTQFIASLYIPAVSSTQYIHYLSDNFGIVKPTFAAGKDCNTNTFGYGFCGLSPLLTLWTDVRDLAYALLTILFVAIGIGVMLRFRVDPRTVMTLQNQIPRVIIAILLITFSFAISGAMIDLMWTLTYAGVNFISSSAPNSKVAICPAAPKPIAQTAETQLLDTPISFVNTIFRADCNGGFDNGLVDLSNKVSASLGDLVQQLVHDLLFSNNNACHVTWWNPLSVIFGGVKCALQNGALSILLWLTDFLIKLIIIITILIALFRLWFQLIKAYLTFLIFVIMGPIWIVLGLIPGRPMGFEKWLRIIFANLAVFPLVAFILVFARVLTDAVPSGPSTPNTVFVPPLVGNPSITTFSDLMGFGAIMIAPTIPDLIKERMKATGQSKFGATIAAGMGMGMAATAAVPSQVNKHLNKRDQYGNAIGPLAQRKDLIASKLATGASNIPGLRWVGGQHRLNEAAKMGPGELRRVQELQQQYKTARKNPSQRIHPDTKAALSPRAFDRYWRERGRQEGHAGHEAWARHTNSRFQEPENRPEPTLPPPPPEPKK